MRIRRSERGHGRSVGIDLGTTYSAVARMNAHGRPEVLANRDGENITPSVVLFDGEQPIVGTMAKRSIEAAPLDVVQFVKRAMGDPAWRFATAAGSAFRPEEISGFPPGGRRMPFSNPADANRPPHISAGVLPSEFTRFRASVLQHVLESLGVLHLGL
jgi:Hsp70 protein